ncbi:hypothetical protein BY458DRAFT_503064 [Sporodiniella umbellata]|nr:hypothetical protein BY458DRAFT_503064 [Sporodiniella umbellata]
MTRLKSSNFFVFYIVTSIAFGCLTTVLSLYYSPNGWQDFFNSRPNRGDMGFGRFLIRGSRFINGKYTPFAYPWRLLHPNELGQHMAWSAYIVHQLGQWFILAKVQFGTQNNANRWSDDYQWWNWQMVYLNGSMLIFKLVHGHIYYDGLAANVPEGIAQGSVVNILVLAIIIAITKRGVIFGMGKGTSTNVVQFVKKYHGYIMSFGTVLNFHYHPVEGTMGHFFGFVYQCLLIWQSTNFLHKTHRSKSWILLLETWVFIHGTLTAIIQPGIGWQIFSYGFMSIFLMNQIFQLPISQSRLFMTMIYSIFLFSMLLGFEKDKAYYRATFIPISEYICVYVILTIGNIVTQLSKKIQCAALKNFTIICSYMCISAGITVGLALVLAGNVKVYNDY